MFLALNPNGNRMSASPGAIGHCGICQEKLIPKCGEIMIWHWSHKNNSDCDPWHEPESEWHKKWKDEFPKEQQEVVIENHRADIKNSKGIIELQNSAISPIQIEEREFFYDKMIWLLNWKTLAQGMILRKKENYCSFRWKHPPKSWWSATKPIYIDLDEYQYQDFEELGKPFKNQILLIKKIYNSIPCGGWGVLIPKEEFLRRFKD